MKKIINSLELKDEILHFGQLGVYWVKYDKSTYSQTAYHKKLLKTPFYPDITLTLSVGLCFVFCRVG